MFILLYTKLKQITQWRHIYPCPTLVNCSPVAIFTLCAYLHLNNPVMLKRVDNKLNMLGNCFPRLFVCHWNKFLDYKVIFSVACNGLCSLPWHTLWWGVEKLTVMRIETAGKVGRAYAYNEMTNGWIGGQNGWVKTLLPLLPHITNTINDV